jgi:hypothetical protein
MRVGLSTVLHCTINDLGVASVHGDKSSCPTGSSSATTRPSSEAKHLLSVPYLCRRFFR